MSENLPFIDEFEIRVDATTDRVFLCACRRIQLGFQGVLPNFVARLLGCVNSGADFTVPPRVGQEASGFRVSRVEAPSALILEGRHRFATYRLSFLVDEIGDGQSRLRARTDALFPGLKGAVYRALVIGSGGHRVVVKRMLSSIGRRAERPAPGA